LKNYPTLEAPLSKPCQPLPPLGNPSYTTVSAYVLSSSPHIAFHHPFWLGNLAYLVTYVVAYDQAIVYK